MFVFKLRNFVAGENGSENEWKRGISEQKTVFGQLRTTKTKTKTASKTRENGHRKRTVNSPIVHHPIRSNICHQEIVGNIGNHLVTMPNLVLLSSQILWVECHAFPGNRVGYVLQLESVSRCLETETQSYLCNRIANFIEIPNISITCGLLLWWFSNLLAYRCMDPTILIVIGYWST